MHYEKCDHSGLSKAVVNKLQMLKIQQKYSNNQLAQAHMLLKTDL